MLIISTSIVFTQPYGPKNWHEVPQVSYIKNAKSRGPPNKSVSQKINIPKSRAIRAVKPPSSKTNIFSILLVKKRYMEFIQYK